MNIEQCVVFLSHNSRDKPAVEFIKGLLERGDLERGERTIPCWFDKDDLRSKGTWMSQLEDAVANSGAAVVFFGPDGHGPVHKYEIDLLLKRAMYEKGQDAIRLVLVLLPGAQESAIQGFISLHMWADFRKGLDDAAALQRLRAFILGEAPTSGPGDDPLIPKPEIEPYRGLEAFEGKHASYFFGRDNEIKELCGRLHEWPFTAVIGGSGSGKSSVVRAGLQTDLAKKERPALAQTTTITVRPGTNPIHALAEQVAASQSEQSPAERLDLVDVLDPKFRNRTDALLNTLTSLFVRDDQQVLLVIDQFEELFTHSTETQSAKQEGEAPTEPQASEINLPNSSSPESSPANSQQTQFVELLSAVAKSQLDRLRIVITLRADFFDRCLGVPTLKSLIENRTLLLGKLSDDALRMVIEAPAFKVGAYFEKGLVARILKDVENQNGSLPLLQHALKELWEHRRFGFLTDDGYVETGGVEGALKKRADATLQNLRPEQREIAKNIFLRLTTLGEGVSDTRRRVRKLELYPEKTDPRVIDAVLKDLCSQANRLIVTNDDGTVEVTHEALIQRWDTLKGWLAENRDDKRLHDRLRDAANEWADPQHERDPSYLWEGGRLELAEKFDQTHPNMLTALEREFLAASVGMVRRRFRRNVAMVAGLSLAFLLFVMVGWLAWANSQDREHAKGLVSKLITSNIGKVPDTVKEMKRYRHWVDPDLKTLANAADSDPEKRLKASLALLPEDETQVSYLSERLLDCSVDEFRVVRDSLKPHYATLKDKLWNTMHDTGQPKLRRFHAGMALAAFAPQTDTWTETDADFLVGQLLGSNPDYQRDLRSYMKELAPRLSGPLQVRFRDAAARDAVREAAASALSEFAADDPELLARLASEATPEQHRILWPKLIADSTPRDPAVKTLLGITQEQPAKELSESARVHLGRRRAGAAINLVRMGERESAFDVFRVQEDPESLTQFVHRVKDRGVTAAELLDCLDRATEERVRFGLLLALGEFPLADMPETRRAALIEKLLDWYRNDPSSAIHGACGCLLRLPGWGLTEQVLQVNHTPLARDDTGRREWFVEKIGDDYMTFVVFPPGKFHMGSPDEPSHAEADRNNYEALHEVELTRPFAMLDREVTVSLRNRFASMIGKFYFYSQEHSPTPQHPVNAQTWYMAVEFCRWLTREAGLTEEDQCYDDPEKLPKGPEGFPENWPFHPDRRGFRLPTEAEWEYACRAGTSTAYGFGSDRSLLRQYGWFLDNEGKKSHVGGELRPNLRGLADMHGNVFEWCHDWYAYDLYPATDPSGPKGKSQSRLLRGGCWYSESRNCRSADRVSVHPTVQITNYGVRVVRGL